MSKVIVGEDREKTEMEIPHQILEYTVGDQTLDYFAVLEKLKLN